MEEIMYCRAVSKLNLTKTVIEDGRFSLQDQAESASAGLQVDEFTQLFTEINMLMITGSSVVTFNVSDPLQLSEILKFGLDKLFSSEESSVKELNLEKILGPSRDGQWVDKDLTRRLSSSSEEEECSSSGQSMFSCFWFRPFPPVPTS